MARQLLIKFHDIQAGITALPATPGASNRFTVPEGARVELVDPRTGRAPATVKARRHGKDLIIRADDDGGAPGEGTDIVLENYYPQSGCQLAGLNDEGQYLQYRPAGEDEARSIAVLGDGDAADVALSGAPVDLSASTGACVPAAPAGGLALSPALLGGLGLGALAVVAAAAGGGGGGGGESGAVRPPAPPATPTQAPVAYRDDVGAVRGEASSAALTDDATPGLRVGALPAGASGAVLYVDGVVTTSVYDPATGTLTPATPLKDGAHTLGHGWSNEGGTTPSSPTLGVVIDTVPPAAPIELRIVDTDGNGRPTLSGRGEPGGTVTITDPTGATHVATVDPDGRFALEIDMPATAIGIWKVFVTDPAGNAGPATSLRLTDDPATAPPVLTSAFDSAGNIKGEIHDHGYTDDNRPLLRGTSAARAQVAIFDGDTLLATVQADKSGLWEYRPAQALDDGRHTLGLRATDPAGNVSGPGAPFVFTVDTVLPAPPDIAGLVDDVKAIVGPVADGGVTNDGQPTLGGWTKPGATVRIDDHGVPLGTAVADDTGYWRFTPQQKLAEGAHQWTATVADQVGNFSAPSTSIAFEVDTIAPLVGTAITSVNDAQGAIQGVVHAGDVTDDAQPLVRGTADPGAIVTLWDGAREIGRTTADATGDWSIRPTTPLGLGERHLSATAADAAGNVGPASDPVVFTVLTGGAPTGTGIDGLVGDVAGGVPVATRGLTGDPTPTVEGKAQAGATVTLYAEDRTVLGTAVTGADGTWRIQPAAPLADGTHTLTAVATDGAGRPGAPSGGFQLTVDTQAPVAARDLVATDDVGAVTGAIADGATTDDATPVISGTAEPGSSVAISDNGVPIGTVRADASGHWRLTPATRLIDGPHALTAVVTDAAGHVATGAVPVLTIVVDTRKVTIAIDGAYDATDAVQGPLASGAATNDRRPVFTGKALAGGAVTLYEGSLVIGTTTADATGRWSLRPAANLADARHDFSATVTTAAGGESGRTVPFQLWVDTIAPAAPQVRQVDDDAGTRQGTVADGAPTDDGTPTLSGTAEAGATVRVFDGGTLLGSVTADALGLWRLTPTTPLNHGTHAITATATDAAGNESVASKPWSVVVDTQAPAKPPVIDLVWDDQGTAMGQLASGQATDDARPDFSGQAEAGATVVLMDGQRVIGRTVANASGAWTFTPTTLVNGLHHITARAIDAAGNEGPVSAVFDLQVATGGLAKAPTLTAVLDDATVATVGVATPIERDGVTNDATPTVQGTAQAGALVTLHDANGNRLLGSATADAQGNWQITIAPGLAEGRHELLARATAANGDVLDPSGAFALTVDTVAPGVAHASALSDDVGPVRGAITAGATTDDATPTYAGTAEPGATVTVWDGVTALGSTRVNADGTWRFTPATALADGRHSFTTTVTDAAGNVGLVSPALGFVVDTGAHAPAGDPAWVAIDSVNDNVGAIRGALAAGASTDDTRPTIVGHATAGGLVRLYDGITLVGTVTADAATGAWSIRPALGLAPGSHALSATVTPAGGPESDAGGSFALTVDTAAPALPGMTEVIDHVGARQGPVASGDPMDDKAPTLRGTAEPGSSVTILDAGVAIGGATADATGVWEFTPLSPLNQGTHAITLTATDAAGNVSKPSTTPWLVVIDTSGDYLPGGGPDPLMTQTISVTTISLDNGKSANDFRTNDTTLVFSGITSAADGTRVDVRLDGVRIGTAIVTSGAWSYDHGAVALADGSHALRADLTDTAGNVVRSSQVRTVVIDTERPQTPVILAFTGDANGASEAIGSATNDTTPTLTGTAEPNTVVTIRDAGAIVGTAVVDGTGAWTFTPTNALVEGDHRWTVTATDAAGNDSVPTAERRFAVDITPPAFTATGLEDAVDPVQGPIPQDGSTNDPRPLFSGTADAGSRITITLSNAAGQTIETAVVVADAGGAWSHAPAQALLEGTYSIRAQAADDLGNLSAPSKNFNFTVDFTPPDEPQIKTADDDVGANKPTLVSNATTDDPTPTLHGVAEAGSTVTVRDNGVDMGTTVAGADGKWTFTPSSDRSDGPHHFRAVATDAAGNVSAAGPDFFLVIDTAGATTPSITALKDDKGILKGDIADGGLTDDATPTLSGTAKNAGEIIRIYDNNLLIGQVTADASRNWSFTTPDKLLKDGSHAYTATATNSAGSESPASTPIAFTLDTVAPTASATVTAMSKDTGADSTDFLTHSAVAGRGIYGTLTAALAAGDSLSVSTDGGTTWSAAIIGADHTHWSAFDANAHAGTFYIETRVSDQAGNVQSTKKLVSVDLDAPKDPVGVALTGNELKVTLAPGAGVLAGDVVNVVWNDQRIEHGITSTDIANGHVIVTIPPAYLSAGGATPVYAAALVDAAGNASGYVSGSAIAFDAAHQHIDAATDAPYHAPGDPAVTRTTFTLDDVGYLTLSNASIRGRASDQLTLTGANQTLDLTGLSGFNDAGKITGIDRIDLTGSGDNTLKLSVNDVLNLGKTGSFVSDAAPRAQMLISGNVGDTVVLSGLHDGGGGAGQWAQSADHPAPVVVSGHSYDVYVHSIYATEVRVEQGVKFQQVL